MGKPFVLRFQEAGQFFLYDVNTNAVMEVDRPLYELIDRVVLNPGDPADRWTIPPENEDAAPTFTDEIVSTTLHNIAEAHTASGVFSDAHPATIRFPFSAEQMELVVRNVLRHIILCVTEQCNMRCEYCAYSGAYANARTHSDRVMSFDTARKAVDLLLRNCSFTVAQTEESLAIGFYGGEPLLQFPLIRKVVDYARAQYPDLQNRFSFVITTNLTAANEDILDYLAVNDFNLLVSLDGPRALHDRYRVLRSGTGSFARVQSNLKWLQHAHPDYYERSVRFSVVLSPPYDVPAIKDYFDNSPLVSGHEIVISAVDCDSTTFFDRFPDLPALNEEFFQQTQSLQDDYQARALDGTQRPGGCLASFLGGRLRDVSHRQMRKLPTVIYPNGCCLPGAHRTFVGADGGLHICEKIGEAIPIGNVDSGFDIEAIQRVLGQYAAMSQKHCCDCWAMRLCKLCFDRALRGVVFDEDQQSAHCESTRASALRALKDYTALIQRNPDRLKELFPKYPTPSGLELAARFLNLNATPQREDLIR